jgi:hypothetical protein
MKFTFAMEQAKLTPFQIVEALRKAANAVQGGYGSGVVTDHTGNIGKWEVSMSEPEIVLGSSISSSPI